MKKDDLKIETKRMFKLETIHKITFFKFFYISFQFYFLMNLLYHSFTW